LFSGRSNNHRPRCGQKEKPMQNIEVHRYADPAATGWLGWIQPEDRSWILYVDLEHRVHAYIERDPATGACL
jgi:hypothetical protein